jgi:molecular chaperone GrpE
MVLQQAGEMLARHQVEPIEAVGRRFDPHLHEAITQMPSEKHPPMTVLQEVEKGYKLHDRVLRPSKVIVAAPQEGDA